MKQIIFILVLLLGFSVSSYSQSIKKEGTTFVQVVKKSAKKTPVTKTVYTFKASDGKVYPIYLSSKGKAFIIRVSKKTGKQYKQYLPEATKQLNNK
jgi:hypothetical protein